MDEDFLDVTSSDNKKIAIFLIILFVLILLFGYFFVYSKLSFSLKKVKIEVGSTLSTDVNDYLSKNIVDSSGYILDTSDVDINEVGEYYYYVTYSNKMKKGTIIVEDTTAPVFEVQELTTEVNDEDFYVGDFLTSCTDASKPCVVSFKNDSDAEKIKTIGTYTVTIVVADTYGNKDEAAVTWNVVEKSTDTTITGDLEYASSSVELSDFEEKYYYLKLDKALDSNSEEARDELSNLSILDFTSYVDTNYPGYQITDTMIVEIYNKSGYVIGYAIVLTITNGEEKTIYVVPEE